MLLRYAYTEDGASSRSLARALLEVLSHSPTLVEGQGVPVLLEERVDTWDATIPRVLPTP